MAVAPTLKLPALLSELHTPLATNLSKAPTQFLFQQRLLVAVSVDDWWCFVLVWIRPNLDRLFLLKPINPHNG